MTINFDGLFSSSIAIFVLGTAVTSVLLLAVCSVCGVCVGCEAAERRKSETADRIDEAAIIAESLRHAA